MTIPHQPWAATQAGGSCPTQLAAWASPGGGKASIEGRAAPTVADHRRRRACSAMLLDLMASVGQPMLQLGDIEVRFVGERGLDERGDRLVGDEGVGIRGHGLGHQPIALRATDSCSRLTVPASIWSWGVAEASPEAANI
jgi:hypothetical protein